MTPRRRALDVLDHVVHVFWTAFAFVGMFTVVRVSGDGSVLGWPVTLGLVAGLLTAPSVLRRVRPALHRRFPDWFENPEARS